MCEATEFPDRLVQQGHTIRFAIEGGSEGEVLRVKLEAGSEFYPDVTHGFDEEYEVLQGRGIFVLGESRHHYSAGSIFRVPEDTPHGFAEVYTETVFRHTSKASGAVA